MIQRKIKTLIEIDRDVWALTRAFATSQNYNISDALKELLTEILQEKGFEMFGNPRPDSNKPWNLEKHQESDSNQVADSRSPKDARRSI